MKHSLTTIEKLGVIISFTHRMVKLKLRFKISFIFTFISMLVSISIFYFINIFIGDIPEYDNYFTFVLVGLAVNQFTQITLRTYLSTMHSIYWSNWLEILLTSPTRTNVFYLSVMIWNYITVSINVVMYFTIGIFIFGAAIMISYNILLVVFILILLIISLSGIGLISASMFMLANAKGNMEPIGWSIATISGLVAGVYFPPDYLPPAIQVISNFLPQTYAIESIREILLLGKDLAEPSIQFTIFILVIFSIILLPIGLYLFNLGIKKGEKDGSLARWI